MKKRSLILLTLLLGIYIQSQANTYIERLDIEQVQKQINISFDLLELPDAQHYYQVNLQAKVDEKPIFANELMGDIGKLQEGGQNKYIAWNAWKDIGDKDGKLTISLEVDLYRFEANVTHFCPLRLEVDMDYYEKEFSYGIEVGKTLKVAEQVFREVTFIYDIAGESYNYFQHRKDNEERLEIPKVYRPKLVAKALIGFWGVPALDNKKGILLSEPKMGLPEMPLAFLCKDIVEKYWGKDIIEVAQKHIIVVELTDDPAWKKKQYLFIFWNKTGDFTELPTFLQRRQLVKDYKIVRVD